MSYYEPGKFIRGRWVKQDFDKYPMHLGYHLGYPSEDEVKPTLSWRIAEAWKAFRGKPTLQERMIAAAPEMYELLIKCSADTDSVEQFKSEIDVVLNKVKEPSSNDVMYENVMREIEKSVSKIL